VGDFESSPLATCSRMVQHYQTLTAKLFDLYSTLFLLSSTLTPPFARSSSVFNAQNHGPIVNVANSEDLLAVSSDRAYRRVHSESSLAEWRSHFHEKRLPPEVHDLLVHRHLRLSWRLEEAVVRSKSTSTTCYTPPSSAALHLRG